MRYDDENEVASFFMHAIGQHIRNEEGKQALHRRIGHSIGIHGKLIVSFMLLLLLAVSASCWVFVHEAHEYQSPDREAGFGDVADAGDGGMFGIGPSRCDGAEHAGESATGQWGLVTIAFFDAAGKPLVVACRDSNDLIQDPEIVPHVHRNEAQLTHVQDRVSPVIGEYAEVMTPVYASTGHDRLVGYVQVNIPEADALRHIEEIRRLAIGAGVLVLLVTLPLVSLLVHGILHPIGHLVAATRRLAAGDLHTQVDIRRNDMIGTLARTFNAMVHTIRKQQDELEAKVQKRTQELELANKKLEREIAEKNDFLQQSRIISMPRCGISRAWPPCC